MISPFDVRCDVGGRAGTSERAGADSAARVVGVRTTDRLTFTPAGQARDMSDKDLLALVLGGVALLMFATGIILAV